MIEKLRLRLYSPFPAQLAIHEHPARFRHVITGRRFGKTWLAVMETVRIAWQKPNAILWWVAPVYDLTNVGFRRILKAFRNILKDVSKQERRIELINGSTIWFRSADRWENLVGEGLTHLTMDEVGRIPDMAWHESLRPTLADTGGTYLGCGTPKGRGHWSYQIFLRGLDPSEPDYMSWQLPTTANPKVPHEEIEEMRRTLPDRVFRQEVLAEFLESNAAALQGWRECVHHYSLPIPPQANNRYYAGLDLAKYQDYTVLIILDHTGRVVCLDRFHHIDWESQINRISQHIKAYRAKVAVDSTGVGDPIFERLYYAGLNVVPVRFTNEVKRRLIDDLNLGFQRNRLIIPSDPILTAELENYEYSLGTTGTIRYSAPPGQNDDCVIALALAWHAMGGVTQEMIMPPDYQTVASVSFAGMRGAY